MRTWNWRLTIIGCALSWYLLGMHYPILHQLTHHDATPRVSLLAVLALLAGMAVATLWILLRAPTPASGATDHRTPAA